MSCDCFSCSSCFSFIAAADEYDESEYAKVEFYFKDKVSGFESPRKEQVLSVKPTNDPPVFGLPVWGGDGTNNLAAFTANVRKSLSILMTDLKDVPEPDQMYTVVIEAKNADSSKPEDFLIYLGQPANDVLIASDFNNNANGIEGYQKLDITVRS